MLHHTGSVVSGSVAVRFQDVDSGWEPRGLDIYTPYSGVGAVVQHMRVMQGYIVLGGDTPSVPQDLSNPQIVAGGPDDVANADDEDDASDEEDEDGDAFDEGSPAQIWHHQTGGVHHVVHMGRGSDRVDIFCSQTESAVLPITYSWGTILMNYFTEAAFVCAYPSSTFGKRCLVTPFAYKGVALDRVVRARLTQAMAAYGSRGYRICLSRHDVPAGVERILTAPSIGRSWDDSAVFSLLFGDGLSTLQVSNRSVPQNEWYVQWWLGGRTGMVDYRSVAYTVRRSTGDVEDVGDGEDI